MPSRYVQDGQYRISFGGPLTPAVKGLIIANVAVYFLELVVKGYFQADVWDAVLAAFALNPPLVFKSLFLWQLVTYMFMHSPGSVFHILFNMLVLWMFGGEIERIWGPSRFVRYYLICGMGGGLLNCAFAPLSQTVGASGAIFGVIVAYGMLFPTREILFWGIFPMSARQFTILLALIELFSLGAFSSEGVARFAHLGGALTGYLLVKGTWDPRRLLRDIRWRIRRRRFRTIDRDEPRRSRSDRDYPFH
ncbi:MAG TPA: rhomboid family intramembrane serine protease [Candidatus Polarisedimenticolia bacterium]|nr:rhomboid family intramembrane serine protease [Candidatus Polarisedimenticolia bacterium]